METLNLSSDTEPFLNSPVLGGRRHKRSQTLRRTKTGCLCCRKRKKKCDERYPDCNACSRNLLLCVWPIGREKMLAALPKDRRRIYDSFRDENQRKLDELELTPVRPPPQVIKNSDFINIDDKISTHTLQDGLNTFVISVVKDETKQNSKKSTTPQREWVLKSPIISRHFENNDKQEKPMSHDFIPITTEQSNLDPYMQCTLNKFRTWIPNVSLSKDDAFLYHLFVTEFMPAISPLHCHPLLSPGAICIPQVIYSPILRKIFISAGAVYLGNKIDEFKEFAVSHYLNSNKLFNDFLDMNFVKGDEDWLLVACLVFILMNRSSGMPSTSLARHVGTFYQIWMKRKLLQDQVKTVTISPLERNLVEGFIFNYSVTILMCQRDEILRNLPSPFDIFGNNTFPDMDTPIYTECAVRWMNNPIVGSALGSYILAAKLSWLCRIALPLDEDNYWKCLQIAKEIDEWVPDELPDYLQTASNYILLKNNISVAVIIMRLTDILVRKMLSPELTPLASSIQLDVELIIRELVKISVSSTECCLPYWGILVAGSATVNLEQLEFFKETNRRMARVLNSNVLVQMNNYLTKVWLMNESKPGWGFESIFDTLTMDKMVV